MRRFSHLIAFVIIVSFGATTVMPSLVSAQSTGDAVKECTVDTLLDSVGGTILDAAKDIGNAALDIVESIPVVGGIVEGIGGFFGLGEDESKGSSADDPMFVQESGEQVKEVKKLQFDTCVKAIKDAAFKVALAKLKKRLLDRMTDDIIAWISDGKDPKFITNFGDFLEEAAQGAVGDTARELGLAELCSPFKYNLPPLTKPIPTFSKRATCTLDDIVDNIEGYYENFANGGWLAYAELQKPQNNPYGLSLLIFDEAVTNAAKKQQEAQIAATVAGGYKPIEQCLEWTLTGTNRTNDTYYSTVIPTNGEFPYFHPYLPPGPGSPPYDNALNALRNPQYSCTRKEITLPPAGTQQIAAVALSADTQVVANSDDLSPYVSAIFDAAVNRIIKEGVKALRGNASNLRSETTTRRPPQTYEEEDPFRDYGEEYENATNFSVQLRNEIQNNITEARKDIATASTTLTRLVGLNLELIATTTQLSDCQTTRLGATCTHTSSSVAASNQRKSQFASDRASLAKALAGIQDIENALTADPNMSEGALRALLSTLGSVRLSLQGMLAQLKTLETAMQQLLDIDAKALKACQGGGYSCTWTPSP